MQKKLMTYKKKFPFYFNKYLVHANNVKAYLK